MTVQAALKAALRDVVGPAARAHGFQGTAPSWRRCSELGDWAVVNVQSSQYSRADALHCVLNVSVAPEPWLSWLAARDGRSPKQVGETYGLYRERLHPTGTPEPIDGWWEIHHDDEAPGVATDMLRQLDAHGWPILERLLDRRAMLDQVRSGQLGLLERQAGDAWFAQVEALLLSDLGPSAEVDDHLAYALEHVSASHREHAVLFDGWIRERAASTGC